MREYLSAKQIYQDKADRMKQTYNDYKNGTNFG